MDSILALPGWDDVKEVVLHHLDAEERREAVLICKDFHATICRLERNKSLKIDEKLIDSMKDETVFNSIMSSRRRFSEIEVNIGRCYFIPLAAGRILAVVEKFQQHMKKLTVSEMPQRRSIEEYTALLNAATGVEDLEFSFHYTHEKIQNHNFSPEKKFSKLKHLSLSYFHEIDGILSMIPDHSLVGLTVRGHQMSEEVLQTFVDRQKKLKKLALDDERSLNVDHLALEELFFDYNDGDDKKLAGILKHQPTLRRLHCETIRSAAFKELRKMRHLEVLKADIAEECAGELTNLKKLELHGDEWPDNFFNRVFLPSLEKFVKLQNQLSSLNAEDFKALSRSSHNLQHIEIYNWDIEFLPTIIELFPKLKSLYVNSEKDEESFNDEDPDDENYFYPAPSSPNTSLEEMVVDRWHAAIPIGSFYNAINACSNLQRICLCGLRCSDGQVLSLVRSHPKLTHFVYDDVSDGHQIFKRSTNDVDSLHPVLIEIINIFRASADFKHLLLSRIENCCNQRVEDLLTVDADRILVECSRIYEIGCILKLVKKSKARDPFENFHKNQYRY